MYCAFLFAVFTLHAYADDYKYLTIGYNGTEKSLVLETVQRITFEEGNMVVKTSEGTAQFAQSQLEKIFFSVEPGTRVESLPNQEQPTEQAVYDLSGRRLKATQLKAGLYIVDGKKVIIKK